jgi:hypothetical protein
VSPNVFDYGLLSFVTWGVWGTSKLGVLEKGLVRELYELRLQCYDHEDLRGLHVLAVGVGYAVYAGSVLYLMTSLKADLICLHESSYSSFILYITGTSSKYNCRCFDELYEIRSLVH